MVTRAEIHEGEDKAPPDELERERRRRGLVPVVCDVCDRKTYARPGKTPDGWRFGGGVQAVPIQVLCPEHPDWKAWR